MPLVAESEYAYWPYMISQLLMMGSSAALTFLGIVLLLHAYCTGRVSIWHLRILAIFLFGICCCTNVALGVAQGLDVIHVAGSVVAGILLWAVLLPFIFLFSGGDAETVLWLRSDAHLVSYNHRVNNNNNNSASSFVSSTNNEPHAAKNLSEFNNPASGLASSPILGRHHHHQSSSSGGAEKQQTNNPYSFGNLALSPPSSSAEYSTAMLQNNNNTQEMKSISNFQKSYHQHLIQNPEGTLFGSPSGIEGLKGPGAKRETVASSNAIVSVPSEQQQQQLHSPSSVSSANFTSNGNFLMMNNSDTQSTPTPSYMAILKIKQEILEEQEKKKQQQEQEEGKKHQSLNKNTIDDDDDDDDVDEGNNTNKKKNERSTKRRSSNEDEKEDSDLDLDLGNNNSNKAMISKRADSDINPITLQDDDSICTEPAKEVEENHFSAETSQNSGNNNNNDNLSQGLLARRSNNTNSKKKDVDNNIRKQPPLPLSEVSLAQHNNNKNPNSQHHTVSFVDDAANNNNTQQQQQLLTKSARVQIYVRNFFTLMFRDIKQRPLIFSVFVIFAIVTVLVCNLMLYGTCVMNKPQSVSTWITRRLSPNTNYCPGGTKKPCVTYPMVGDVCSSMVLVSHFVVGDDTEIPTSVSARVCLSGKNNSNSATSCNTIIQGVIRNNDNIQEDRRYIGNVYVNGLTCGEQYTASVTFRSGDGNQEFKSREFCFKALSGDLSSSSSINGDNNNSTAELSFIEGGDYVAKGRSSKPSVGKTLLARALEEISTPSFFSIIGDISYENNMRRCYRRVDEFLMEVTEVLKINNNEVFAEDDESSSSCMIPIMTGVGNHDSGGYLWQGDLRDTLSRMSVSAFYYQYFPFLSFENSNNNNNNNNQQVQVQNQPENGTSGNFTSIQRASDQSVGDVTDTFRVHLIGTNNSYIVADSGHWSPLEVQAARLRSALTKVRSMKRTAIVSYHVPTYPSTRDRDSSNRLTSTENRPRKTYEAFSQVLSEFDDVITTVFEHHDHNYKRTERIHPVSGAVTFSTDNGNNGIVNNNNNASSSIMKIRRREKGRGIVFCGDGALGASDEDEIALEKPPLKIGFSGNYVSAVRMFVNGSIFVKAIGVDGALIDEFLLE